MSFINERKKKKKKWNPSLFLMRSLVHDMPMTYYPIKVFSSKTYVCILHVFLDESPLHFSELKVFEPAHNKPAKWHVCPLKTQIILGIHPV